jgi:hypothetical protein
LCQLPTHAPVMHDPCVVHACTHALD